MNQLGKYALVAAAVTSSLLTSQAALAEVSANFGATSNYVWRGVSQSNDIASVSGGIDYADDSGFYAGTWVGSLSDNENGFAGAETDLYFGYGGESGNFTYDVGYIYYLYTDIEDGDFGEIYFNGGVGNFGFGIAYTVNSQLEGEGAFDSGDVFLNASYGGIDLGNDFELGLTLGYYAFDVDGTEFEVAVGDVLITESVDVNYSYVQADISKGDFTFSISKASDSAIADEDLKLVASWGISF